MQMQEASADIPVIVPNNSGQINITFSYYMLNENRAELKNRAEKLRERRSLIAGIPPKWVCQGVLCVAFVFVF